MKHETPSFDPLGVAKDNAWKALSEIMSDVAKERPSVGKKVRVIRGKKHLGKEGVVFWHGSDRFQDPNRYADSFQSALRQARGTYFYRVGVMVDETQEKIFVPAENVEILGKEE